MKGSEKEKSNCMNLGEISERIKSLDNWALEMGSIQKTFNLKDFKAAIDFVNKVADIAEKMEHHPSILVNYNKVKLILTTHSAKGLTEKDFEAAAEIDRLDL